MPLLRTGRAVTTPPQRRWARSPRIIAFGLLGLGLRAVPTVLADSDMVAQVTGSLPGMAAFPEQSRAGDPVPDDERRAVHDRPATASRRSSCEAQGQRFARSRCRRAGRGPTSRPEECEADVVVRRP